MAQVTITEALAEVKLIKKKIEGKAGVIFANLSRPKHLPDPLGDSKARLSSEAQSISDLRKRWVGIRRAIAQANLANTIRIGEVELPISDWLAWKREIAKDELAFYNNVHNTLKQIQDRAVNQPQAYKDDKGENHIIEYTQNLSYPEFLKLAQETQEMLDKLDGQLSLKNATILVNID